MTEKHFVLKAGIVKKDLLWVSNALGPPLQILMHASNNFSKGWHFLVAYCIAVSVLHASSHLILTNTDEKVSPESHTLISGEADTQTHAKATQGHLAKLKATQGHLAKGLVLLKLHFFFLLSLSQCRQCHDYLQQLLHQREPSGLMYLFRWQLWSWAWDESDTEFSQNPPQAPSGWVSTGPGKCWAA